MKLNEKLEKLSSKEPSGWLEKAEWRRQNRSWLKKSAQIAFKVLQELRRQQITQRELAERLGVSAQQVNKIVKGQENLTLDTLDKLERALNIPLLHDSKMEATIVFDFGDLPVAQKVYGRAMSGVSFYSMRLVETKPGIDINPIGFGSSSAQLHTRFPIAGKEKWLQFHSEHS